MGISADVVAPLHGTILRDEGMHRTLPPVLLPASTLRVKIRSGCQNGIYIRCSTHPDDRYKLLGVTGDSKDLLVTSRNIDTGRCEKMCWSDFEPRNKRHRASDTALAT